MSTSLAKSALGAVTIVLIGCATRPENVVSEPASPDRYATYDCQRLTREGDTATYKARALAEAMGIEVSYRDWYWKVPPFRIPGIGKKAEEQALAKQKGELAAINQAWHAKGCARSVRPASDSRSDTTPSGSESAP